MHAEIKCANLNLAASCTSWCKNSNSATEATKLHVRCMCMSEYRTRAGSMDQLSLGYDDLHLNDSSSHAVRTTVLYITLAHPAIPQFAFHILSTIPQVFPTVFIP